MSPEHFFSSHYDENYVTNLCQGAHLTEFELAKQKEDEETYIQDLEEQMYSQF